MEDDSSQEADRVSAGEYNDAGIPAACALITQILDIWTAMTFLSAASSSCHIVAKVVD